MIKFQLFGTSLLNTGSICNIQDGNLLCDVRDVQCVGRKGLVQILNQIQGPLAMPLLFHIGKHILAALILLRCQLLLLVHFVVRSKIIKEKKS